MKQQDDNRDRFFGINNGDRLSTEERAALWDAIAAQTKNRGVRRLYTLASAIAAMLLVIGISIDYAWLQPMPSIQEIAAYQERQFDPRDNVQQLDYAQPSLLAYDGEQQSTALLDSIVSFATDAHLHTSTDFVTLHAPYGKRQEVVLPDGSKAWLNSGSYITFARNMETGDRLVYINGEAFFDVRKSGQRFVVQSQKGNVAVMGTTFNIKSYNKDNNLFVELFTGSIAFENARATAAPIVLQPGEQIHYDLLKNSIKHHKGLKTEPLLWHKKQIALEEVKLSELFNQLERVYNTRIVADPKIRNQDLSYSGRINADVDIVTALQALYELKEYTITLRGEEVHIRKN